MRIESLSTGVTAVIQAMAVALLLVATAVDAGTVTLNLENADINALIKSVADATGENFVVDPQVEGKVTVISSRPLDEDELYQVFLSILKVHGYAAVKSGPVIRIVPDETARSDSIPMANGVVRRKGDELITRVVEVENVAASEVAPILRPLIPEQGHLAAYPASNVLIISDRAANVERLLKIIKRVDVASTSEMEVVPLRHASATEIVDILERLEKRKRGEEGVAARTLLLAADERTNSVLISGDRSTRLRIRAIITHLDTPRIAGGNTLVVRLRHANAVELVEVLTGVVESAERSAGEDRQAGVKTKIQADESTNALVITAPADIMASLRSVIDQLDVRRAQVLVEALIAEVGADRAAEFGVQWRFTTDPNNSGPFGGTNFNLTGNGINQIGRNPLSASDGLTLGTIDGTVNVLGTNFLNIASLVRLLGADSANNVLSTPSLVTLDNEEAEIVVGQNVPFITGQFTDTGATEGATNPFQTIERQDVGITLQIKPQITEGDSVRLDINQEISSIATAVTTAVASDIITNKRAINTSVLVDDGEIVVLGGLLEDNLTEDRQKIPLLGDLPLLGALFRYDRTSKVKTNLMVFLQPSILRDSEAHTSTSRKRFKALRDLQRERNKKGVQLLPDEQQPLLDEMLDVPNRGESGNAEPSR